MTEPVAGPTGPGSVVMELGADIGEDQFAAAGRADYP